MVKQARSQGLRLRGEKYILGRQHFGFPYMFKTNFLGHKKFWGAQTIGGELP